MTEDQLLTMYGNLGMYVEDLVILYFFSLQDASRKQTGLSQRPGEWAGTMMETINGYFTLLFFQKKWDMEKRFW